MGFNRAFNRICRIQRIMNYWDDKEIIELQDHHTHGVTTKDIAIIMNRNVQSIRYMLKKLGLLQTRFNPWTKEQDNAVIVLNMEGKSHNHIGKVIGRTPASVRTRMTILKVKLKNNKVKAKTTFKTGCDKIDHPTEQGVKHFSDFEKGECLFMPQNDRMICAKPIHKGAFCQDHHDRFYRYIEPKSVRMKV